jgi:hypothetical protein
LGVKILEWFFVFIITFLLSLNNLILELILLFVFDLLDAVLDLFKYLFTFSHCFETILEILLDFIFNIVLQLPPELGLVRESFFEAVKDDSLPIKFLQHLLTIFGVHILDSLLGLFVDSFNILIQFLLKLFHINICIGD